MPRKLGGRGIKEIMTAYKCRIVSTKWHLTQHKKNIKYLNKVIESEENCIIRAANELINQSNCMAICLKKSRNKIKLINLLIGPEISILRLILKGMRSLFMNRKLTLKIYNIDMT